MAMSRSVETVQLLSEILFRHSLDRVNLITTYLYPRELCWSISRRGEIDERLLSVSGTGAMHARAAAFKTPS